MTHSEIGKILGYPECCVQRWIEGHGEDQAILRGVIDMGPRSPEEIQELSALLDKDCFFSDTHKKWVPCEAHMHTEHWRPW